MHRTNKYRDTQIRFNSKTTNWLNIKPDGEKRKDGKVIITASGLVPVTPDQ
jgi:hypothetical protein